MKRFILVAIMFGLIGTAHAALAPVTSSIGADDVYEINNATPGTSKTFLGTRLYGIMQQGATTYAAGDNGNPAGKCVSGTAGFTTPTTTVFKKTTGAAVGESYCLGDGLASNQRLTIVLATDGGTNFYVTPLTKTGFTSVQLDDAKDSVTLKYIDSSIGWVIDGNNGATIN